MSTDAVIYTADGKSKYLIQWYGEKALEQHRDHWSMYISRMNDSSFLFLSMCLLLHFLPSLTYYNHT